MDLVTLHFHRPFPDGTDYCVICGIALTLVPRRLSTCRPEFFNNPPLGYAPCKLEEDYHRPHHE